MSYRLQENLSLEGQIDYASHVQAALEATPETQPLAAPWTDHATALRQARDARDQDRLAVTKASARVRVCDANWDAAVSVLSGEAFLAAGKDAKAEPYVSLFGSVTAADAKQLGPSKASAFGTRLTTRAGEIANDRLTAATTALAEANTQLAGASEARNEAEEKALLNEVRRRRLLAQTETLVDTTEVGILTRFPGRRDLVRAVLAPPRSAPRREPADTEATAAAEPGTES